MRRIVWLVLLSGCSPPGVHSTNFEPLRVSPTDLALGSVYLGASSSATVHVTNPNLQSRSVPLDLAAPFATDAALTLNGGESKDLTIHFVPAAPGPASATLRIDETDVALHATALADLSCPQPAPCHSVVFEPDAGACVDTVLGDGTGCSSSCVQNGQCEQGTCRGSFKGCDDGNGCSLDSCSEELGCLHQDVDCPAPADPCLAAYCDAQLGCGFAPVQDGVQCGPDDCASHSGRICLNGACAMRPLPSGQLCFEVVVGVAGGPGYRDGRGDDVRFLQVNTFGVDPWDNVYVFDSAQLRKVTPGGVVSTVATQAQLGADYSDGIRSVDRHGNVYVTELLDCGSQASACVKKVTPLGQLSVVDCACRDGGLENWYAWVFATRDGNVWALDGRDVKLLTGDGGWEVRSSLGSGTGYITVASETPAAELVFIRETYDSDSGTEPSQVVALSADGGLRVVRELGDFYSGFLWSIGPDGELLAARRSPTVDGGCEIYEDDPGQPPRTVEVLQGWPGAECELIGSNVSTFTGSRYWNMQRSFDGGIFVFEGAGVLDRLEADGGLTAIAGIRERPGTADGFGADAGLVVIAGYGFARPLYESMIARPGGGLMWVENSGQALRRFTEDGGVVTLASSQSVQLYDSLQALGDGGIFAWAEVGWTWLSPGGDAGAIQFIPADAGLGSFVYGSQGVPDPAGGFWVFQPDYQGPVHLDANGEPDLQLQYLPMRQLLDGPILDAGFYSAHGPLLRANGAVAFLDAQAVRQISGGVVTTLAGSTDPGNVDGPGLQARFTYPLGLAESPSGELYVADSNNFAIRVIDSSGNVRTVGRLTDRPSAVTVTPDGTVWVLVRDALLRGR